MHVLIHWQVFVEEAGNAGSMDFGAYRDLCSRFTEIPFVILKFGFSLNLTTKYPKSLPALNFHE